MGDVADARRAQEKHEPPFTKREALAKKMLDYLRSMQASGGPASAHGTINHISLLTKDGDVVTAAGALWLLVDRGDVSLASDGTLTYVPKRAHLRSPSDASPPAPPSRPDIAVWYQETPDEKPVFLAYPGAYVVRRSGWVLIARDRAGIDVLAEYPANRVVKIEHRSA